MELPLARVSAALSPEGLLRTFRKAEMTLARVAAADEAALPGATAFTHPGRPRIRMVNFAAEASVPPEASAGAVVEGILAHFAAAGVPCYRVSAAGSAWPEPLAAALEAHGYRLTRDTSLYRLEGSPSSASGEGHPGLQVIPGRAAYGPLRGLLVELSASEHGLDAETAGQLAQTHLDELDEPRLEVFLGRLGGQAVGVASVLATGQVGVIWDLSVHPDYRGRGIARALVRHAFDFCARAQSAAVIVETVDGGPAARLYAQLGFRRLIETRVYRKSEQHQAIAGGFVASRIR